MKTAPQAPGARRADRNRLPAVLTVASAVALIGQPAVRWRLRSGRWQRPCRGVLVTHSGGISDPEWLRIAVLAAGPQAVLGGLTAARLDGLTGFDDRAIHLVLPACRQVRTPVPGVVVHRSRVLGADDVHPARRPPRTGSPARYWTPLRGPGRTTGPGRCSRRECSSDWSGLTS